MRNLAHRPTFTAIAVVALGLGIGASTAIFSVLHAVALRPLPWPAPDRIVAFEEDRLDLPGGKGRRGFLLDDVREWSERSRTIDALAAYMGTQLTLTGRDEPVVLEALRATPELFRVLGVEAALGRTFSQAEVDAGDERLVVLSAGAFDRYLDGDRSRVGRPIRLDGAAFTLLGVMPPGFVFPDPTVEAWVPLVWRPPTDPHEHRQIMLPVVGRLAEGATVVGAEKEGDALLRELRTGGGGSGGPPTGRLGPGGAAGAAPQRKLEVVTLEDQLLAPVRPAMRMLVGAVVLVMLIACANVANLVLTRNLQRRRELATRAALGAGRLRLGRLLLLESLALGAGGALLGLVLALIGVRWIRSVDPGSIPRLGEVGLRPAVVAFAIGLALLTALLFGVLPAATLSIRRLMTGLGREVASGGRPAQATLRSALVVVEVALALVLLIGAGLLSASFVRLATVDPGFTPSGMLTARVSPPSARYPPGPVRDGFLARLLDRVGALPGVAAAGLATSLPPAQGRIVLSFQVEGRAEPADLRDSMQGELIVVGGDYFDAMGVRTLEGRVFGPRDRPGAPPVVVVNASFARRFLPADRAVGERLASLGEIVGVVGDVREQGLHSEPQPSFYVPISQAPEMLGPALERMHLVVRGENLGTLATAVRAQLAAIDPEVPLEGVETMEERLARSVAQPRFYAAILGVFAVLSLLLAVVGVYGVLSFAVSQEARQTGIRIALGAPRSQVLARTLRRGLGAAVIGIGLGLVGAVLLRQAITGLLFGIEATDPATFVGLSLALLLAAAAACWVPARRAASADPIRVLRHE
jgi:predicted permease